MEPSNAARLDPVRRRTSRHGRPAAVAVCMLVLVLVGCQRESRNGSRGTTHEPTVPADPVVEMEAAIAAGDWQLAERFSKRVLIAEPENADLVTKVATVAAFNDRKREAAMLLVEAARLGDYRPVSRVNFAIQALVDVGEIYAAIDLLEASLERHPEDNSQRRLLVGFLNEVQRTDRIPEHLQKLIENRDFDLPLLVSTTETSSRRLSEATSSKLLERHPDDRRVRLAESFVHLYRRDAERAATVLEDILAHHPDFAPAHAMYGQALSAGARWEEVPQWLESAPAGTRDFADYWLTIGDLAAETGEFAEAARAYWEATRRDPNSLLAWDRLRSALQHLDSREDGPSEQSLQQQLAVITDHANELLTLRERFNDFTARGQSSQTAATQVAKSLTALGRLWEAEAWSAIATTLVEEPSGELAGLRQKIVRKLQRDSEWFAKTTPALAVDLSHLPSPALVASAVNVPSQKLAVIPAVASTDHLRLSDVSDAWGLRSIGQGNNPTDARLAALIRSTGVGGGAIDYDLDGLSDLIVMNAGGSMLKSDSQPNDLMRNVGTSFVRVTDSVGVGDRGFGQGVAVGDFNEDGFPDLFFANLGANRLLQNNGDGTFTDCTDRISGGVAETWSTSASFADIDQDSLADLVVTRYCQIVPGLDQACLNDQGVAGVCHPLRFPADTGQFFVATPEGRLVDVAAEKVDPVPGRGLGIVAGALFGSDFGIFVANDMSRNSFYSRREGDAMLLTDEALTRGVAVDARSQAQASMGIAASDLDRDGDLDFYVTGFAREYNVYYEQISPGMWRDETSKLGLIEPTLMMVGFGTQAIDLESDGLDELIVTNGHIGDFRDPQSPPYALPLQVFRRGPQGTYLLVEDDSWGEYFRTPHVGRGLFTIDANRDGRNDVVITHAHEQLCLLLNEGRDSNDRVGFKLVATDSSRDAVGAVVRFSCNGEERTLWSLSGDGYFCSNEKTLLAGLGRADEVTDVQVTWQDGSTDSFGALPTNARYLLVQGESSAFVLDEYGR